MCRVSASDWVIHQLDQSHAAEVARLHQKALDGDVLPALGQRFLVHYYQCMFSNDSQVILGALYGDKLIGFCQVSFEPISIASVITTIPSVLAQLLWLGLTRPVLALRGFFAASAHPKVAAETSEISFIVVDLAYQGRGVGKHLIFEAIQLARNRGCTWVVTKTANEIARSIYEKSFAAQVVRTSSLLGKRFWYLSWPVNRGGHIGR